MRAKYLIPTAAALLSALTCLADMAAIPRTTESPITIDGAINAEEYAGTTMIGGMIHYVRNRMISRDVEVCLSSTPEALYLAVRTPVEDSDPDGRLVANADKDGGPVYSDDCIEFFIGD